MLNTWQHVGRNRPCPVCGKADWCIISPDGNAAICYRVPSDRERRNGGWLHFLGDAGDRRGWREAAARPSQRMAPTSLLDAAAYLARLRAAWGPGQASALAASIDASEEAVERLEAAWDERHQAYAFPMRDGDGRIVGIRLRNNEGRKWAVTGSRSGLFYPADLSAEELVILEGPTDTAAALTIGLAAVGRASCCTGAEDLAVLIRRLRVKRVTIVSDNDRAHRRERDYAVWRPGSLGAESLAAKLGCMYRIVMPPLKDFREWASADKLDKAAFENYAHNTRWRIHP